MEDIYKIRVRTNPDPRWLYPSERRYSASIVLGLGVVHLALAGTAILLACLTLTGNVTGCNELLVSTNNNTNVTTKVIQLEDFKFENASDGVCDSYNLNTTLTIAPVILCLGAVGAGFTGLLAWKRWYIDHNITWFFSMSIISTVTSTTCLIMSSIYVLIENRYIDILSTSNNVTPNSKYVITLNILIATILELIWSILSTKCAYVGMMNDYPDDIVVSKPKGGRIEKSIVCKGSKKPVVITPDILNHFPVNGKIAKYLPKKKKNNNLPKEESCSEFQDRVNKFLCSNVETNGENK